MEKETPSAPLSEVDPASNINNQDRKLRNQDNDFTFSYRIRNKEDEQKKELRGIARKCMGAILFKKIGNERLMAKVSDYEAKNGWFKVKYIRDNDEEDMSKEELIQNLVEPDRIVMYLDRLPPSLEKRQQKRKRARVENLKPDQPKIYPKRRRKSTKPASDYVPLAFCEKKKDEYYWY